MESQESLKRRNSRRKEMKDEASKRKRRRKEEEEDETPLFESSLSSQNALRENIQSYNSEALTNESVDEIFLSNRTRVSEFYREPDQHMSAQNRAHSQPVEPFSRTEKRAQARSQGIDLVSRRGASTQAPAALLKGIANQDQGRLLDQVGMTNSQFEYLNDRGDYPLRERGYNSQKQNSDAFNQLTNAAAISADESASDNTTKLRHDTRPDRVLNRDKILNIDPELQQQWGKNSENQVSGRWSNKESQILYESCLKFVEQHPELGEGIDGIENLIRYPHQSAYRKCWTQISKVLPERSVQACWRHARNTFGSRRKGKWSEDEFATLRRLYQELGPRWKVIGDKLNRTETSCRDKLRDIGNTRSGKWTKSEDKNLISLINEYTDDDFRTIPWVKIGVKMPERSLSQLRSRWRILDPNSKIRQGSWTVLEDLELCKLLSETYCTDFNDVRFGDLSSKWTSSEARDHWKFLLAQHAEDGAFKTMKLPDQVSCIYKAITAQLAYLSSIKEGGPLQKTMELNELAAMPSQDMISNHGRALQTLHNMPERQVIEGGILPVQIAHSTHNGNYE